MWWLLSWVHSMNQSCLSSVSSSCRPGLTGWRADEEDRERGGADLLRRPRQEGFPPLHRQPGHRVSSSCCCRSLVLLEKLTQGLNTQEGCEWSFYHLFCFAPHFVLLQETHEFKNYFWEIFHHKTLSQVQIPSWNNTVNYSNSAILLSISSWFIGYFYLIPAVYIVKYPFLFSQTKTKI